MRINKWRRMSKFREREREREKGGRGCGAVKKNKGGHLN